MANNKLTIKVNADTTEALEGIKELTKAANECVDTLEKYRRRRTFDNSWVFLCNIW